MEVVSIIFFLSLMKVGFPISRILGASGGAFSFDFYESTSVQKKLLIKTTSKCEVGGFVMCKGIIGLYLLGNPNWLYRMKPGSRIDDVRMF